MKKDMKRSKTVFWTLLLITTICWRISTSADLPNLAYTFAPLFAAYALLGLALVNFISSRHTLNDTIFDGLDKAYVWHKNLGIFAISCAVIHALLLIIARPGFDLQSIGSLSGYCALALFIILILMAIYNTKINHEKWKRIHSFMIVPYIIAVVHFFIAARYPLMSFYMIWLATISCIGILSGLYSTLLYEKTAFVYHYKIVATEQITTDVIELIAEPLDKKLPFKAGQFTFLQFKKGNTTFPSHPFTISSSPSEDVLRLSIKADGNDTIKIKDLTPGDIIKLSKAHGTFDYIGGTPKQIWVGAGIGITPFRSFYRGEFPKGFDIDLYYAYNNPEQASYLHELEVLKHEGLTINLHQSSTDGYLTAEKILQHMDADTPISIYFCGPHGMREAIYKGLTESEHNIVDFHYEEFGFGR